jgi:hypothetical protein
VLFEIFAFTLFLLVLFFKKLIAVISVNLLNTSRYPILQGRLYSSLPGQNAMWILALGISHRFT